MAGQGFGEQSEKAQMPLQSAAFLVGICICAAVSAWCFVSSYAAMGNNEKITLDGKINPNIDTAVSIARLPSLGNAKAKAVIEYRQSGAVFNDAADLDNVKGIGPKTVENVRPYLKFE
jgi:competence ComEA-like helix-hairpin-helix protein